ncbi:uncharacterized protein LOC106077044 [Biomphalaria glabrata]|uniref:Uncharacterized protein LOC106077044 n=1 Tax=Biomphalaria glabrata TaxID=6526 RepID=A0A9U8ELV9_BIOGL|nr:uncharacterized protein LOC106077044 [Biomphalaria glabrata]
MKSAVIRNSLICLCYFTVYTGVVCALGDRSLLSVELDNNGADIYFIANGSKALTVEPRMDVTFYCYIPGTTSVRAVVTGNGYGNFEAHYFNQDSVQFTLSDVTCKDGGQYTCRTLDEANDQRQATVNVSVKCAPALKYPLPPEQIQFIQTSPNINTDMAFDVFGFPDVNQFELLYQQNTSWWVVGGDKYSATYVSGGLSSGWVFLVIYDLNYENTTNYKFIMTNSVGSLEHRIRVVKSFPKEIPSSDDIWLWVGLGICCGIIVVLVSVTCVIFIRGKSRGDLRSELTMSGENNFDLKKPDKVFNGQMLDTYRPTHTEMMTVL